MKNTFSKRLFLILLLCALVLGSFSIAFADTGPKPTLTVNITGIEGDYYACILSKVSQSGPWHTDTTYDEYLGWGLAERGDASKEAWDAFKAYADPDGFYFVGFMDECSGDSAVAWNYMRPEVFKLLIYDGKEFYSGDVTECYAFSSEFDAVLTADAAGSGAITLQLTPAHNTAEKLLALSFRILFTIGVELLIALLFRFRSKGQILAICLVNLVTQIGLNLMLGYQGVFLLYVLSYALLEILIIVTEALLYAKLFKKQFSDVPGKKVFLYSLLANACSFVLGYLVSLPFPMLFK